MKDTCCAGCPGGHLSRRDFLSVGSLGFLGLSLGQYLQLSSAFARGGATGGGKATSCILVWLEGGPSQMDTWDPKSNSSFKPISTNVPGIQISELMPNVAKHMDKLSIIRSMHTEENGHSEGSYYAQTGHRPSTAIDFPSIGSIVSKELGAECTMPPYVVMHLPSERFKEGIRSGFLGSAFNPMHVPDPNKEGFSLQDLTLPKSISADLIEHRQSFLKVVGRTYREKAKIAEFTDMDAVSQKALTMLLSPEVERAFDLGQESEKIRDTYGRTRTGQSMLLARRLVEAGCKFVTADAYRHNHWDTHATNDKSMREDLVPPLDQSLAALMEDLKQRGLFESTIVLVMGEFGRTPEINADQGRDHWADCWSLVVGGGGIAGGRVVGSSDERAAYVSDRMVTIGDLFATIYTALGIDYTKTYLAPGNRPVYIANSIGDKLGEPIKELL